MNDRGNDAIPTSTKHLAIAGYDVHFARFGQNQSATHTIESNFFEAPIDIALSGPMSDLQRAGKDMLESILLALYSQAKETLESPAVIESFETAVTSFVEHYEFGDNDEDKDEVCECGRPPHLCTFRDTGNHEDA